MSSAASRLKLSQHLTVAPAKPSHAIRETTCKFYFAILAAFSAI
jgi:hypothetical protein